MRSLILYSLAQQQARIQLIRISPSPVASFHDRELECAMSTIYVRSLAVDTPQLYGIRVVGLGLGSFQ